MRLIIGLGNPGSQYQNNRHNIGFMAVDAIHGRNPSFSPWRTRFQGLTSEGMLGNEKVLLLKPTTYMNESGRSVGEAMRFYKIAPEDMAVIYDELDLPPAKFRMKAGGGHGGHNGLRSITAHIGDTYRRLRLGIGHPGDKRLVSNYVLGDFAKKDNDWLEPLLANIADHASLLAQGKDSQFANKMTLSLEPEKARRPKSNENNTPAQTKKTKGQSHIRQARRPDISAPPQSGPMAEMLKKLLNESKD